METKMGTKEELAALNTQVEALKKILENTNEITELLQKHPDLNFQYPWLFREKNISAKTIAKKITEIVLPQLTKQVALKIAERARLEKQIKDAK